MTLSRAPEEGEGTRDSNLVIHDGNSNWEVDKVVLGEPPCHDPSFQVEREKNGGPEAGISLL